MTLKRLASTTTIALSLLLLGGIARRLHPALGLLYWIAVLAIVVENGTKKEVEA